MQQYIHGPDFPTGASIIGSQGITDLHSTGKGSVVIRAKSSIETTPISKNRRLTSIVITELPYLTNKAGNFILRSFQKISVCNLYFLN